MISEFPILSATILLPFVGALLIFLFIRNDSEQGTRNTRNIALFVTLANFVLSLGLLTGYDATSSSFQFEEKLSWLPGTGISYHLGIDGISIYFILLTTFLMPICILSSWRVIKDRIREYMIAFLIMESLMIGVFSALDFVLFYIFFEAALIPMFLIIGVWGGKDRVYAAFKFFLYTLLGSLFLLLALIYIYLKLGTTDFPALMQHLPSMSLEVQKWLFLAFLASFAVKVPMWPVHTWLPDAHIQAPTAGSVILAGILLKMGAYGFLRLSLPMLPDASAHFANLIFVLSIIAVIYTSLVALMQSDMKKLIAYSSVAHMGFVTIGIFSFNTEAIEGAIFQMLSHGLISGALFLCVGVVYDRMHTRQISKYGGLVNRMPVYALFFMIFTMGAIGLPSTSGFVGEFLILLGAFRTSTIVATLAATGVVLGAAYMLWLYARVMLGEIKHKELEKIEDLDKREFAFFLPLVFLVILIGVLPNFVLTNIEASVLHLVEQVKGVK